MIGFSLGIPVRYELRRSLGRGGMGQVLQVYDHSRGEVVALKLLDTPDLESAALARFRAEFRTLSQLRHPNLVSVYDFGYTADNIPYFTMTFVPGQDLLTVAPRLSAEALTDAVVQICRALAYIHSRGLIHGDVKPANILVVEAPDGPAAWLTDFGLAREQVTEVGLRLRGTVGYMAPEVIRGDRVDGRADLYALGCALYQVLTGRLPFTGETTGAVLLAHLEQMPVPPQQLAPDALPALGDVALALLAKQPARRYPSANAVIEAINEKTGADFPVETAETRESYVLSGHFVGREAELARLWSLLEACVERREAGSPTVVLVSGESGAGKSRLVREFRLRGQLAGVSFLSGSCVPGGEAYRPFLAVLRLAVPLAESHSDILERHADALSRLLPATPLAVPSSEWPALPPEAERLRLVDEVGRFLVELAAHEPFVLIIEDLHWADEGTVALLAHLARLAPGRGLLLCATCRVDEVGAPLEAKLAELRQEGRLEEIPLPPLNEEQVTALVASMFGLTAVPAWWQADLTQATGGNPYFLEEWLKLLAEEGRVTYGEGRWQLTGKGLAGMTVPAGAAEAVARRLDRLEPSELEVLRALAVFEAATPLDVLAQVADLPDDDLHGPLNLLERRGFVRRDADRCRFYHETGRRVVYNGLSATHRRALHTLAAAALEEHYGTRAEAHVEELAHHCLRGTDREKALRYGRRAADHSRQVYANDRAIDFYAAVLTWLGEEQGAQRAAILEALGDVHHIAGAYDRAIVCYEEALVAGGQDLTPQDVARLRERIGYSFSERHENEAALTQYEAGLVALGETGRRSAEGAKILSNLGLLHKRAGRYDQGLAACLEAADILAEVGDSHALIEVFHILQAFYRDRGEWERFAACLKDTLATADRLGDQVGRTGALVNLAIGLYMQGKRDAAIAHWEEAFRLSRKIGHILGAAATANNLGIAFREQGVYRRAADYFQEAMALAEPLGGLFNRGLVLSNLAEVYYAQGAYGQAIEALEEALDCYARAGDQSATASALNQKALIWLALGQSEQARETLQRALAMACQHDDLMDQAECHLSLGREALRREAWAEAESHVRQALALFKELGVPAQIAEAQLVLAELAYRHGDLQVARLAGEEVLTLAEELRTHELQTRAHLLLGQVEGGATALRHLKAAVELAGEMPELRWQAHHLLGRWHHRDGNGVEAARHYAMARDILKTLAEAVPEAHRPAYLADPGRQRFRADVAELLSAQTSEVSKTSEVSRRGT